MERFYLESHEWVVIEGDIARIGISEHAQESLGDIVFIELPKVGTVIKQKDEVAVVESMKAASPINAPLSGTVETINDTLTGSPEKINISPLEQGWMLTITNFSLSEIDNLMNEEQYKQYLLKQ